MQEPLIDDESHDVEKRVKKSSKKGKEKETSNRTKAKGGKKKRVGDSTMEALLPQEPEETAEERAERERVSFWRIRCWRVVA